MLEELQKEFKALNNSPVKPDWFSLGLDAKHTSVMVDGIIVPYTIYTVIGTFLEGERKVLLSLIREGGENLRRVLIVTHDDYPGLIESYFPKVDVRLCVVHFLRNLKKRLSPQTFREIKRYIDFIKSAVSSEHGLTLFEEMLHLIKEENPAYTRRTSLRVLTGR